MIKSVIWTSFFGLIAVILQSTLLARLALYGAVPDIVLGIVVYSAYVNGVMAGQLSGFFTGIVQDFVSAAPFGLNAFVRLLVGALAGLMKGTFFLDVFLLPMILCALATLAKALIIFLLSFFLGDAVHAYPIAAPTLWAELALNIFIAPFLFAFLRRFKPLLVRRDGV